MTDRPTGPLHVLFVLHHPGFIRHYEVTLAALADKGHRITLGFNMERNKIGEQVQLERLLERCPSIKVARGLEPTLDRWHYLGRAVRLLQDYARYFDPRYEAADALRERATTELPPLLERLCRVVCRWDRPRRLFGAWLEWVVRVTPLNPAIYTFLRGLAPDVLLVTPLVDWGSDQVHLLKSAEALGIPSALCVASWDNLTNKGAIRYAPTRVIVWNAAQEREAVEFHGVPASRVVVTGAQTFDHWFGRQASRSREVFCAQLGLDPDRPILLYLGSSFFIAPDEAQFFDRFLRAMRQSSDPRLRDAGVIVRPHPLNIQQWLAFDYSGLGRVAVFPTRAGVEAFSESFRSDFFDSLYHAAAAVGVNTSAMIEAGIVGRPVFTVLAPEFRHSQEGTIHFRHLTGDGGGVARATSGIEEAFVAIGDALSNPGKYRAQARRYIEAFVRPRGWEVPASEHLQRAIETLGAERVSASPVRWRWLGCVALFVPAFGAKFLLEPKVKPLIGPLGTVQGPIVRGAFVLLLQPVLVVMWTWVGLEALWRPLLARNRRVSDYVSQRAKVARRARQEFVHEWGLFRRRVMTRDWLLKQRQEWVVKPLRRVRHRIDDVGKDSRRLSGRLTRRTARLSAQTQKVLVRLARRVAGVGGRALGLIRRTLNPAGTPKE